MSIDLAAAMRRATQKTRVYDLGEATRIIQEALGQRAASAPAADAPAGRLRRSLDETLALLREGRLKVDGLRMPSMPGAGATPQTPDGATYEWRSFSCAAGSRRYRLYRPASTQRPRGLVVMLHGCTQNPDDFAVGTGMNAVAEANGLAVAYPEQTRSHNMQGCWNWFDPRHQRRDAGEPAIVAGLTREIVAELGVDPSHVYVAGLSSGGALAAVMGDAYPELYAAVGVHSGLAAGSASDVAGAFAAMRGDFRASSGARRPTGPGVRTIVFHGRADRTVDPSNAAQVLEGAQTSRGATSVTSRGKSDGGRSYERELVTDRHGSLVAECWRVDGLGHAWSGGKPGGSYVDAAGPDASAEMARFFLED